MIGGRPGDAAIGGHVMLLWLTAAAGFDVVNGKVIRHGRQFLVVCACAGSLHLHMFFVAGRRLMLHVTREVT